MKKFTLAIYLLLLGVFCQVSINAQSIFSGEPVQVVGAFNGYATIPYQSDYRTTTYRRVSTQSGTPTDGRGQWATTINVQNSGGNVVPINMPGGGGNGFLFISGPIGNRFQNKWDFSGVGQATLDGINNISAYNSGNDMGLNMSVPGYYSFIFNDCGYTQTNARFYVAYTSGAPVSVARSSQTANPDFSLTIGITTGATPSPEEKIYVRYTTGLEFSGSGTSSVVQASGSGTAYSATIPAQAPNSSIRYFVFSSTRTLSQLSLADFDNFGSVVSEADKNISILRYDDNAGANYTQLAPSAASVSVAGRVVAGNGRGISRAVVSAVNQQGQIKTVVSNPFGYFRINELDVGETYIFEVRHKIYSFAPQVLNVSEDINEFVFVGQ